MDIATFRLNWPRGRASDQLNAKWDKYKYSCPVSRWPSPIPPGRGSWRCQSCSPPPPWGGTSTSSCMEVLLVLSDDTYCNWPPPCPHVISCDPIWPLWPHMVYMNLLRTPTFPDVTSHNLMWTHMTSLDPIWSTGTSCQPPPCPYMTSCDPMWHLIYYGSTDCPCFYVRVAIFNNSL